MILWGYFSKKLLNVGQCHRLSLWCRWQCVWSINERIRGSVCCLSACILMRAKSPAYSIFRDIISHTIEMRTICSILLLFQDLSSPKRPNRLWGQWRTQEFFFGGRGGQQIQLRTERTGIWGGILLVRGSGGSCNLVQEISFHIVKFS